MLNVIGNPKSFRGKGKKLLKEVADALSAHAIEYRVFETAYKGQATEFAYELTKDAGADIVIVGGDGTLNEVFAGIVHPERCTLGLIPAGTGNDFAASAGIPNGIAALDAIIAGKTQFVDYIEFSDGRRSMNITGLGMDVDILTRCENMKHFHKKSKYFFSLIASLFKYRGTKVTVRAEGETISRNILIAAICNGKQLGGGIPLCPPAKIDDDKLELIVVDCPKRIRLLGALIKLMKGKILDLPFARRITCETASIIPEVPCFAQYDGELFETNALNARVVSGVLRLYRG
ncbi:MAG: diacylglycerol kinase family lipid kinase [Clostridiales bacterium]|nr:diacylglycerol kinase family lipid kinase [Clostridiales bacterium]